ncbi:acyltransferase domain-containing protein, partial [Mycobacterium simiae]
MAQRVSDIAVVGLACRLPGAASPREFWKLLRDGLDVTSPETAHLRAEFLDAVADFDASFFNLSPREARSMDPRQRLALELTWELLETASIAAEQVDGDQVGVFIGAMNDDYAVLTLRNADEVDHHSFTGVSRGLIANRISYTFGMLGPSLTVDCGQSSSLVAVHLACESLRTGESSLAVAGGVQLNLAAETAALEEHFGGLSESGRTYTFDERADGYVRGDGGALLLLKPLSAAIADGDHVHAVIRGSAVCNDGRGEAGLTVPSIAGQLNVLRRAYRRSDLRVTDVDYVELHGTGTPIGDPIEATALGHFFLGRDCPLAVGSVKTNVGHLGGAAGIVGLLKTILAVENSELPASLNYANANPAIDLDRCGLRVNDTLASWPVSDGRPRRAGVSSFGMGGTNAHVVVEQAPLLKSLISEDVRGSGGRVVPWLVSAKSAPALAGQAQRLADFVQADKDLSPLDVGLSLARRSAFEHRAVVVGARQSELAAGLAELAAGLPGSTVVTGRARASGKTVLLFPGQGTQWLGMGAELLDTMPVFAQQMRLCDEALAEFVQWSLLEVIRGGAGAPGLDRVDVVQPVLWAVMVSLARLWESVGVKPDAVVGHSQGEIAAACVAGVLSLRDAALVVTSRSRLLMELGGAGGMVSLAAGLDRVQRLLADFNDRLSVAAVNGVSAVVVAGENAALAELLGRCEAAGIRARNIEVDYASHSAQVEPIAGRLEQELAELTPGSSKLTFISTVTGGVVDGSELSAQYWFRNLRQPVRLDRALGWFREQGYGAFVEVSPHPVLIAGIEDSLGADVVVAVPTLVRNEGGPSRFWLSVGQAYVGGVEIDWPSVLADGRRIELPTYAFARQRFWLSSLDCGVRSTRARRVDDDAVATESAFSQRLHGLNRHQQRELLVDAVCCQAGVVLGHLRAADVDADTTFSDLGFDSFTGVELRDRLKNLTGLPLSSTSIFDYPTPARLAEHLEQLLSGAVAVSTVSGARKRMVAD